MENKELDLTYVKIANARSKSLKESRSKINGEMYVSHDPEKRKKIEEIVKGTLAMLAIVGMTAIGGIVVGTPEMVDGIRDEINEYNDPEFNADMQKLNDYELLALFDETAKELREETGKRGPAITEEVVARMEENHDLETGKSK